MRRALLLAAVCFVLVLILRFPARWLSPLLPHGIHCQQLDGSAWSGSCSGLSSATGAVGDVTWELQALQLLRGRLALKLDLTNQGSFLRGELAFGLGGAIHGHDLNVDLPLSSGLISSMPAGTHARLLGKLSRMEWTGKYLSALQGELDVQDLINSDGDSLGNYQAIFAPETGAGADTPSGVVHDTGGPLALDATLQFTHDPGYVVQGRVGTRPAASPGVADFLKYLGSPDAAGRRPFSFQGTF